MVMVKSQQTKINSDFYNQQRFFNATSRSIITIYSDFFFGKEFLNDNALVIF